MRGEGGVRTGLKDKAGREKIVPVQSWCQSVRVVRNGWSRESQVKLVLPAGGGCEGAVRSSGR